MKFDVDLVPLVVNVARPMDVDFEKDSWVR